MQDKNKKSTSESATDRFRRLMAEAEEFEQDLESLASDEEGENQGSSTQEGSVEVGDNQEDIQSSDDGSEESVNPLEDTDKILVASSAGDPSDNVDLDMATDEDDPDGKPQVDPSTQETKAVETVREEDTQPMKVTRPISPVTPRTTRTNEMAPRKVSSSLSQTPPQALPPIDQDGFPLPRSVNEVDPDATRVSPVAYGAPRRPVQSTQTRPYGGGRIPPAPPPNVGVKANSAPRGRFDPRKGLGCALRAVFLSLFVTAVVAMCGASFAIFQYYSIARTLPDIRDLRQRASQFETTRILDRNGNVLYEILDPTAGRRTYVRLDKVSPYVIAATVATEDKAFYSHPGVDILAIARAFWQNYQSGDIASGASTITQQLARALLFSPEERGERTYDRKLREAILATEITRRYSKDEILELYLNEIYYGNLAYGIEAASQTYFGISAEKLTLGQASFLAGLPQAPSIYDVYTNREAAMDRLEDVMVLMYEASQDQGCIYVSNYPQPVCLDPVSVTDAVNEIRSYEFRSPDVQMRYPHWVNYIRWLLESQYDSQTIYRSGFTVYTTLDPGLQDIAQKVVKDQVAGLVDHKATDGALVAIRPSTGEILAMVGSADFYNEAISGQVNMAVSPRQPGSAIKPLTYLAAFEKGWTPSTLIWDVPSEFPPSGRPDDTRPPYKPVNYDGRFHGPVTVRSALANSYNVPAVKALDYVGIYSDPENPERGGLIELANRMGIDTLTRPDYGLSLTLGGGDVTLLQLTNAYATLANGGRRVPPVAITRILDHLGNTVYDYRQPQGEQVVRPEHAYLISSILSDNRARAPMFGQNSVLNLPFQVAAKTGTTNDFRDNWTLGYTPDVAVGVWIGNADYTPMQNTTGLTGAAPIWSQFTQAAIQQLTGGNPATFTRPGGIVEYVICEVSGTQPSKWCPGQMSEIFAADQPPPPKEEDLWQRILLDTWTELRASPACSEFTEEKSVLNVTDQWAKKWIKNDSAGRAWAENNGFSDGIAFVPNRDCRADDPRPRLDFSSPRPGQTINSNPLEIFGIADATEWFDYYRLEYGEGDDPISWKVLDDSRRPVSGSELIYSWDLSELVAEEGLEGPVTLRLYLHSIKDTSAEYTVRVNIKVPTPTPTPTATPTETPTPTLTPTVTVTPTPMPTLTPSPTPTQTKIPKATDPPPPPVTQTPQPTSTQISQPTATQETPEPSATTTSMLLTPTVSPSPSGTVALTASATMEMTHTVSPTPDTSAPITEPPTATDNGTSASLWLGKGSTLLWPTS